MYDVTDLLHVQVLNKIFLSYAYKHKGFWTLLHIKRLHGTTAITLFYLSPFLFVFLFFFVFSLFFSSLPPFVNHSP